MEKDNKELQLKMLKDLAIAKKMSNTEVKAVLFGAKASFEEAYKLVSEYKVKEVEATLEVKEEEKKEEKTVSITDMIAAFKAHGESGTDQEEKKEDWTYNQWQEKDPNGLMKMYTDEPDKFKALTETYV